MRRFPKNTFASKGSGVEPMKAASVSQIKERVPKAFFIGCKGKI